MSLVLNTNMAAMNATRNLATTQNQQATTFERLSTGLRVNSAKDDAAGLYLAQSQTKDIRGLSMATRNANDGISMAQTAEGALDQIGQNLQRINELAIQSANGTYSNEARDGLQKEVDELTQEINRIVEVTEFNGQKLLNEDAIESVLQIGFQNDANSRINAGIEDGILNGRLLPGEGETLNYTFGNGEQMFDVDPAEVINGRTSADNVVEAFNAETAAEFGLDIDTANGQFTIGSAMASDLDSWVGALTVADLGIVDDDGNDEYTATTTINGIEFTVEVTASATNVSTINGASVAGLSASINGETVTLGAVTGPDWSAGGAYENGGTAAFQVAIGGEGEPIEFASEVAVWTENALVGILDGGLNSTQTVNISTQENAQFAIQQTREAIDFVSELRATFGAKMNRFEAVISGNQIYSENLSAARSRIQDADFAVETSNLAKQQVLQQAGISSLSQANASSQAILGLLG